MIGRDLRNLMKTAIPITPSLVHRCGIITVIDSSRSRASCKTPFR